MPSTQTDTSPAGSSTAASRPASAAANERSTVDDRSRPLRRRTSGRRTVRSALSSPLTALWLGRGTPHPASRYRWSHPPPKELLPHDEETVVGASRHVVAGTHAGTQPRGHVRPHF